MTGLNNTTSVLVLWYHSANKIIYPTVYVACIEIHHDYVCPIPSLHGAATAGGLQWQTRVSLRRVLKLPTPLSVSWLGVCGNTATLAPGCCKSQNPAVSQYSFNITGS